MADIEQIKRNISAMAAMGAPQSAIEAYIRAQGSTPEAVRAFQPQGASEFNQAPASFRDAQWQSAMADRGALNASAVAGGQSTTYNFGDEFSAGAFVPLEMAVGALTGEDAGKDVEQRISDAYSRGLDLRRGQIDAAQAHHPHASLAGQVAGGLVTAGPGLGAATTLPGRIAVGAVEGIGTGGVSGFADGRGRDDRMTRAETDAQLGALFRRFWEEAGQPTTRVSSFSAGRPKAAASVWPASG